MIQELELSSNDPLITHFKKIFESHSFQENRHNVVKITEKSWCKNLFKVDCLIIILIVNLSIIKNVNT